MHLSFGSHTEAKHVAVLPPCFSMANPRDILQKWKSGAGIRHQRLKSIKKKNHNAESEFESNIIEVLEEIDECGNVDITATERL